MRKLERVFGKHGRTMIRLTDKIVGKSPPHTSDRVIEYWSDVANNNDIEKIMRGICDELDKNAFEGKPMGLVEILNDYDLRSKKVMDLACGLGRTCKFVAPKVREYVGVDFVSEMIEKAKNYNALFKNAKFYVNDGKTLVNFQDDSFDLVYCELAIQHMDKPVQESYVNEVFRILKPDGIFLVQIPKMEFYNDENYARTEQETRKLLSQYTIELENGDAYYIVNARKHNVQ